MTECGICGKTAIDKCARCGMLLCSDHIKYGVNLRTNAPTINCSNCKKEHSKKLKLYLIISTIIFSVAVVIIILYINSILNFF